MVEYDGITAEHEAVDGAATSDELVARGAGILGDIIPAVAGDADDGSFRRERRIPQHLVRMFDRFGEIRQPADVPFHLIATFGLYIDQLARFEGSGRTEFWHCSGRRDISADRTSA